VDIVGQLREGVSRKIEDTIYVVSHIPQSYYYGWSYARPSTAQKEQAWVYSFDVSDAKNPRKMNELQLFEGGSVQYTDGNGSYTKYFRGVAISATANALMVVENWQSYGYAAEIRPRLKLYSRPRARSSLARAVARLNLAWTSCASALAWATCESPSSMALPTPAW
jgi:hypothetical protein